MEGACSNLPHSTAILRMRRNVRRSPFTVTIEFFGTSLPMPGIFAHQIACNRVQRGIRDGGESKKSLNTARVENHRSGFRVRLRKFEKFPREYPEDRRCAPARLRPRITRMNLTETQCPSVFILCIIGIIAVLGPLLISQS